MSRCAGAAVVLAALVAAIAVVPPAEARTSHAAGVRILDRSASKVLKRGSLRVRVSGLPGQRFRVRASITSRTGKRLRNVHLAKSRTVVLDGNGRPGRETAPGIEGPEAAATRPRAVPHREGAGTRAGPRAARGEAQDPAHRHDLQQDPERHRAPPWDGCGNAGEVPGRGRVGQLHPPPHGTIPGGDPADCDPSGTFDGPRPFAYMEPYKDIDHTKPPSPTDIPQPTGGRPCQRALRRRGAVHRLQPQRALGRQLHRRRGRRNPRTRPTAADPTSARDRGVERLAHDRRRGRGPGGPLQRLPGADPPAGHR